MDRDIADQPVELVDALQRDMYGYKDVIVFDSHSSPDSYCTPYVVWAAHDYLLLQEVGRFNLNVAVHHARKHLKELARNQNKRSSERVAEYAEQVPSACLLPLRLKVDDFQFELPKKLLEFYRPPFKA